MIANRSPSTKKTFSTKLICRFFLLGVGATAQEESPSPLSSSTLLLLSLLFSSSESFCNDSGEMKWLFWIKSVTFCQWLSSFFFTFASVLVQALKHCSSLNANCSRGLCLCRDDLNLMQPSQQKESGKPTISVQHRNRGRNPGRVLKAWGGGVAISLLDASDTRRDRLEFSIVNTVVFLSLIRTQCECAHTLLDQNKPLRHKQGIYVHEANLSNNSAWNDLLSLHLFC